MQTNDIYDEFCDYFTQIVQQYSKDGLVLSYNMLYLTKGLLSAPVDVRNKVIDDICDTSYESISEVFNLNPLPRLKHRKLLRIISNIRALHN